MAQVIIPWTTGTGNIILNFTGTGNGTVIVTSDDNDTEDARSQDITVRTLDGSVRRTVTIVQAGGSNFLTSDGKSLKLSNGLFFNVKNE